MKINTLSSLFVNLNKTTNYKKVERSFKNVIHFK